MRDTDVMELDPATGSSGDDSAPSGRPSIPVFYEPAGTAESDTEWVGQPMGLPRRLALLTAVMAVLLVLGATEIALSWSARTRLEDFRLESVPLAHTLASLLQRA